MTVCFFFLSICTQLVLYSLPINFYSAGEKSRKFLNININTLGTLETFHYLCFTSPSTCSGFLNLYSLSPLSSLLSIIIIVLNPCLKFESLIADYTLQQHCADLSIIAEIIWRAPSSSSTTLN